MMSLLVVLPNDFAESEPLPEPLQQALASAGVAAVERGTCHTLVQKVGALAPQQVIAWLPAPAQQLQALLDALGGWKGAPPCALGLVSASLDSAQHEALVALGVHAWLPIEAFGGASLRAVMALAQARREREAALRTELDGLRTRMDERKWVDRAKGLLMSSRGIGEDEAFGLLRGAAMHANLRLGEVSRSVIEAAQWADAINRAGQLRMLSQRLVRIAAQMLAGIDVQRARVLRTQSVERVQQNLDHLATLELGAPGAGALGDVQAAWSGLSAALAARAVPQALADIDKLGDELLAAAEALTDALEASGARRALRIVNICGRQRMRAQRLAKDALLASALAAGASRERLLPTMNEFEAALLELERAPLSSPDIRAALAAARDEWLRLVGGVQALESPEGRATLVRSSEALVDTFERLTAWYEHSLQVIMS
ncbi:type IV pili methyl-accepting chemotaxis transducer N-terminal domain-containing protein [Variovorax paradoxus]|uniref:type IV pili methyl-accepting chemotaxis transducer N-terminal domain-containing protein n=1 Tax=Variovorax paradoxus TaxID=34073 RepID=UPI00248113B1|nr:type IV pili methyl-accepting chemotaxis transducer N-terminal domain-containing protein [Variovorax paradoxus]WGT61936.1 type IV pili methyl-accepting chemotaxis transducer N-terminal domain-containing protein [Variovorax paradoxus]